MHDYAYLGDVTISEFTEIRQHFPNIVGIGMYDENHISIGIDKDDCTPDLIGLYQLIIALWNNPFARKETWDSLETNELI